MGFLPSHDVKLAQESNNQNTQNIRSHFLARYIWDLTKGTSYCNKDTVGRTRS
jgi:hypothetical protein